MSRLNMFGAVEILWAWLNLSDYDTAIEKGTIDIISRYSRGNVASQNGWVLDEDNLSALATAGDKAASNLSNSLLAS